MPTFVAKKLCPELVVLPSHFDKYKNVSNVIKCISLDIHEDFKRIRSRIRNYGHG